MLNGRTMKAVTIEGSVSPEAPCYRRKGKRRAYNLWGGGMGTDRSTEFEGPCACGAGTFHIDDCSPDHGWPTSTPQWYEASIRCPRCSKRYELVRRGKRFVLIDRADIAKAGERRAAAHEAAQVLLRQPGVIEAVTQYAEHLDGLPSMAAIRRQLVADGFMPESIVTFRQRWRGASGWLKARLRPWNLPAIYAALGRSADELNASLHELEQLDAAAAVEPTPVGNPIYEL